MYAYKTIKDLPKTKKILTTELISATLHQILSGSAIFCVELKCLFSPAPFTRPAEETKSKILDYNLASLQHEIYKKKCFVSRLPVKMKIVAKINNFVQLRLLSKLHFQLTDDNRTTTKVENNCLCEYSKKSTSEVYFHMVDILRSFPSISVNQLTVWVFATFNQKMVSVFIVQQSYFHQRLSGLKKKHNNLTLKWTIQHFLLCISILNTVTQKLKNEYTEVFI